MKKLLILFIVFSVCFVSCKNKGCTDETATNYNPDAKKDDGSCEYLEDSSDYIVIDPGTNVVGYSILEKLPGIWDGPVTSPTPLGSFPVFIVDFRPISPAQVSAKNELDEENDIFMSFFIAKHAGEYKVAFRNGGGFAGQVRTAYMLVDSVSESAGVSFYRFIDPAGGKERVNTTITFKDDSLIMHTFTNQYNTLSTAVTHMKWSADLRDASTAQNAISLFNYPQKQEVKDFSSTFDGETEAVYYGNVGDPYPETEQPHVGISNININITNPATVNTSKKVMISITAQPLFNNFVFQPQNLDYRSRYVFIDAAASCSFSFNYMHPGNYYVNCIYDDNGDFNFSSGDYMNGSFDIPFTLGAEQTISKAVTIDFQIP